MKKTVSLIVPVYKKQAIAKKCILMQLKSLNQICQKKDLNYELIAVIDGNMDKSRDEILSIKDKHLKLLHYEYNRGKGFAVRYGMMKAKGDYIGFIDMGLDISTNCIKHMVRSICDKNNSIVVGSKKHPKSKLQYTTKRKLFSWGYSLLVQLTTGIKYTDTQVGAKMFKRELIDSVLPRLLVKRYAFDVEILSVANRLGYKTHKDIPVEIDFTIDISSATNMKTIINMIKDTLAVFYRMKILHYYDDHNKHKWSNSLYDLISIPNLYQASK